MLFLNAASIVIIFCSLHVYVNMGGQSKIQI